MDYSQPYNTPPGTAYTNGNPITGQGGSIPPGSAFEHPQRELVDFITKNALTASSADLGQLAKAAQIDAVRVAQDTGSANAMSAALNPVLAAYVNGMLVRIRKGASANTSAVTLALNGLSARPVVWANGTALAAGDLGINCWMLLIYDLASTSWIVVSVTKGGASGSLTTLPHWEAHLPSDAALTTGVNNVINFGSTFTEKVSLPNTAMVNGIVTIGNNEGGWYNLTANAITAPGPGPSEMILWHNGTNQIALQTVDISIGFGINCSVARDIRLVPGDTLKVTLYPSYAVSVLAYGYNGPLGGVYNITSFTATLKAA